MNKILYIIFISFALTEFSCLRLPDQRLVKAESVMEQNPDSAMAILSGINLADDASEYDRQLYNLLYAHAQYKNFIDEDNDSILKDAVEFFSDRKDWDEASKSLFLLGSSQMNANRLGEAVVSFKRGRDIAEKSNCYLWEGQCARGLSHLYGKILDSSGQLRYAKEAHEAFSKGMYENWADWSTLDIAAAYNNMGLYDEALTLTTDLIEKSNISDDRLLRSESMSLNAHILYNMDRYKECLDAYASAYVEDSLFIMDTAARRILSSASRIDLDTCNKKIIDLINSINKSVDNLPSFAVLAEQGKYKEAYHELANYRIRQDSIIDIILENNVTETADQYEKNLKSMELERGRNKTIIAYLICMILLMLSFAIYYFYRMQIHKKESKIEQLTANIEGVRNDLKLQIERTESLTKNKNHPVAKQYLQAIKGKYSKVNALCDEYYQNSGNLKSNEKLLEEAIEEIANLNNQEYMDGIEEYVDSVSDNLYTSFKNELPDMSKDQKRLFLYYIMGFSPRSISAILGQKTSAVYNKKSRLKSEIERSDASRKDEYLKVLKC